MKPSDVGLAPSAETAEYSIILDGKVMAENLKQSGKDLNWLHKDMHRLGIGSVSDIFYASCGSDNRLYAYKSASDKPDNDIFL